MSIEVIFLGIIQHWRSSFCKRALECNGHWSPFPFSVCTKCRIHSSTADFDRRHSVIEKVLLWLVCSLLNCRINANGFSDIFCIRLHSKGDALRKTTVAIKKIFIRSFNIFLFEIIFVSSYCVGGCYVICSIQIKTKVYKFNFVCFPFLTNVNFLDC